jgi:hypothetical protein
MCEAAGDENARPEDQNFKCSRQDSGSSGLRWATARIRHFR